MLEIEISTSILGCLIHPYIEIKSASGACTRQYFEYGSKGTRYLHLPTDTTSGHYTLTGHHIKISSQPEAPLYQFPNPDLTGKRILVLAPHPDDAEIAAYGLYSTYAANCFILTISPGENGSRKYKELYSPKEQHEQVIKKGELRTWDSLTVPLMAGVKPENLLMLGYFNETLQEMYLNPDQEIPSKRLGTTDTSIFRRLNTNPLAAKLIAGSHWRALVTNIQMVLSEFCPEVIIMPHPHIDAHEDHQYSTIALLEALEGLNIDDMLLLLYTNHYDNYPYGRMGGNMPLPSHFDAEIMCDGIYSFALTPEVMRNKILAFDAMRDLRPNTDYRRWQRLLARGFSSMRARAFSIEKDYFNMYVRSNELFYTFSFKSLRESGRLSRLKQACPHRFV